jgi:hypothetical protein
MVGHFLIVFLLKLTQYPIQEVFIALNALLTTDTALVKIVDAALVCLRVH